MAPRKTTKQASAETVEKSADAGDVSPPKRKKVQKATPDTIEDVPFVSTRITRNKQNEAKSTVTDTEGDKKTRGRTNAAASKKAGTVKQSAKNATARMKNKSAEAITEETQNTEETTKKKSRAKAVTKKAGIANGAEPKTKPRGKKKDTVVEDAEPSEVLPPKRGKTKKNGEVDAPKKTARGKTKAIAKVHEEEVEEGEEEEKEEKEEKEENGNVSEEAQETEMEKPVKVTKKKAGGKKGKKVVEEEEETKESTSAPKRTRNIKKTAENVPEKKSSRIQGKAASNANVKDNPVQQEAKSTKGRGKKVNQENPSAAVPRTKKNQKKQTTQNDTTEMHSDEHIEDASGSNEDVNENDEQDIPATQIEDNTEEVPADDVKENESKNEDSKSPGSWSLNDNSIKTKPQLQDEDENQD